MWVNMNMLEWKVGVYGWEGCGRVWVGVYGRGGASVWVGVYGWECMSERGVGGCGVTRCSSTC